MTLRCLDLEYKFRRKREQNLSSRRRGKKERRSLFLSDISAVIKNMSEHAAAAANRSVLSSVGAVGSSYRAQGCRGADRLRALRSSERRFGQMNVSQWSLFSSGHPSAHMLIARMCIEAADVRIRLHSSRGLSTLPTTPPPPSADYCSIKRWHTKRSSKGFFFWDRNLIMEGEGRGERF